MALRRWLRDRCTRARIQLALLQEDRVRLASITERVELANEGMDDLRRRVKHLDDLVNGHRPQLGDTPGASRARMAARLRGR